MFYKNIAQMHRFFSKNITRNYKYFGLFFWLKRVFEDVEFICVYKRLPLVNNNSKSLYGKSVKAFYYSSVAKMFSVPEAI